MYFTEGHLIEYEKMMREVPRYNGYEPKPQPKYDYRACAYCLYYVKKKCTLEECCIPESERRSVQNDA